MAKLFASDPFALESFGYDVAVDDAILIVGDPFDGGEVSYGGAAYVFNRQPDGSWVETQKLIGSEVGPDDFFGTWVAIDGETLVVASPAAHQEERAVHVFERVGGLWVETARLVEPDPPAEGWGSDVAIDGDTILIGTRDNNVGGPGAGAIYVFERDEDGAGNWGAIAKLKSSDGFSSDRFGHSVAIDGDTLVGGAFNEDPVGSIGPGAAYVFERGEDGAWREVVKLTPAAGDTYDYFGYSVAIDGNTVAIGAPGDDDQGNSAGAVYVFERNAGGPGAWGQVRKLLDSDFTSGGSFGWSVALENDVLVGGTANFEVAYVFQRHAGGPHRWQEVQVLRPPDGAEDNLFGSSVAMSGGTVAVGAEADNEVGFSAGAVYVFERADLTLGVSGSCPGTVELTLAAATPGNPVALLRADGPGGSEVPAGIRCAGTPLGLDAPGLMGVVSADESGELSVSRALSDEVCGQSLQAVDLASCRVSGVVALP